MSSHRDQVDEFRKKRVLDLRAKGLAANVIGERLGMTTGQVHGFINRERERQAEQKAAEQS